MAREQNKKTTVIIDYSYELDDEQGEIEQNVHLHPHI